jgi:hypothetical protein
MKSKGGFWWSLVVILLSPGAFSDDFISRLDPFPPAEGSIPNAIPRGQDHENVHMHDRKLVEDVLTLDSDGITVGRERRDFNLDVGGDRFELPEDQRAREAYYSDSILDIVPSLRLRMGF